MNIRDAAAADVPALARVAARSYAVAFSAILEAEALARYDVAYFESRFIARWPRMRVAEQDDALVAFCVTTGGHIDMIFADPDSVGAGAGGALMTDAEARGARTLECFADNADARAFYERRGWLVTRSYEREFAGKSRCFVWYEKG